MSTSIAVMTFPPETTPLAKNRDCAEEFSASSFGQRRSWRVAKPVKMLVQELDCATVWHRLWISSGREDGQYRRHFEQAATQFPSGVRS